MACTKFFEAETYLILLLTTYGNVAGGWIAMFTNMAKSLD